MPNWTSNTIRAEGSETDLRAFLETVKWEDRIFDFNPILPMPELLRHTGSGCCTIDGEKLTSWYVVDTEDLLPDDQKRRRKTIFFCGSSVAISCGSIHGR